MEYDTRMDAQTLAEAEVIRADNGRLMAAKRAAGELAKDAAVRAKSYNDISESLYPSMDKAHNGRTYKE